MPKKKETRGGWNKKYKTEAERKAAKNAQAAASRLRTTSTFAFRFNNLKDAEIIAKLKAVENQTDYIRKLIANDINKGV